MTPKEFVNTYKESAFMVEKQTGIPAIAILAQAALESGWGKKAIGNNLFGIKYNPKVNSKFQEVLTPEFFENRKDFENKGWNIASVEYHLSIHKFRVMLYAKFADYETIEEGFLAHAKLLQTERYKPAMQYAHDPKEFLKKVWECGYATDPYYGKKMSDMVDSITKRL